MITVTFHGWRGAARLPETVDIDGKPMRIVDGVLAAPGAAVEIEAREHDRKHERFIEAILKLAAAAEGAMGNGR